MEFDEMSEYGMISEDLAKTASRRQETRNDQYFLLMIGCSQGLL